MDYLSENCPNDFPSGVDYKPVSAPSPASIPPFFLAKQRSRPQSAKVTAVSSLADVTNTEETPRVAVAATAVLNTGLDWSDSDDEYVTFASLTRPVVHWNAIVHGPSSFSEPMRTTIDPGCKTVLIREDVVSQLKLQRRKLNFKLPMVNAFEDPAR